MIDSTNKIDKREAHFTHAHNTSQSQPPGIATRTHARLFTAITNKSVNLAKCADAHIAPLLS